MNIRRSNLRQIPLVRLSRERTGFIAGRMSAAGRDAAPYKDTNMSTNNNFTSTQDQMKAVKAAWDKAPTGPKKDAALKHYQAAEKSHAAHNEADCLKSLDAAKAALV